MGLSLTLGVPVPGIDVTVIHVHDEDPPVLQEVALVTISLENSRIMDTPNPK